MAIDTIKHLLGECNYVPHVWAHLTTFLPRYNITMHFSLKYFLLVSLKKHIVSKEIQVKKVIIWLRKKLYI